MSSKFLNFLKVFLSEQLILLLQEEVELVHEGTEVTTISTIKERDEWKEELKSVLPELISKTLDELSDEYQIDERTIVENPRIIQKILNLVLLKLSEGRE